jgi:hypothetical protein
MVSGIVVVAIPSNFRVEPFNRPPDQISLRLPATLCRLAYQLIRIIYLFGAKNRVIQYGLLSKSQFYRELRMQETADNSIGLLTGGKRTDVLIANEAGAMKPIGRAAAHLLSVCSVFNELVVISIVVVIVIILRASG